MTTDIQHLLWVCAKADEIRCVRIDDGIPDGFRLTVAMDPARWIEALMAADAQTQGQMLLELRKGPQ